MKYMRIQTRYCGKTDKPVGIFGACHHLRRKSILTAEEDALFRQIGGWFIEHLPQPPFYKDGNPQKAVTWFKTATAADMLHRLAPLVALLDKYRMEYDYMSTNHPGQVIYEDAFQVAVI